MKVHHYQYLNLGSTLTFSIWPTTADGNYMTCAVTASEVRNVRTITPHGSTTCVEATYCYRPSRAVCRSLCLSDTVVSPAKTAEPIEMPFELRTRAGPRKHRVLDEGPDPPWEVAISRGKEQTIVKYMYRDTLR